MCRLSTEENLQRWFLLRLTKILYDLLLNTCLHSWKSRKTFWIKKIKTKSFLFECLNLVLWSKTSDFISVLSSVTDFLRRSLLMLYEDNNHLASFLNQAFILSKSSENQLPTCFIKTIRHKWNSCSCIYSIRRNISIEGVLSRGWVAVNKK